MNKLVQDEQGLVSVGGPQTIRREITRQTSHRTEKTFKCLRHVMRNEVLVNLSRKSQERESGSTKVGTDLHHRD